MNAELVRILDRVACAARVLVYAQDAMPGDDLGVQARAQAWFELRESIRILDRDYPGFNAREALFALLVK